LDNVRQNIKILVAPLDWGLGHATRCIPIIRSLIQAGYEVLLAGEGKQAILLSTEFPQLTLLPLRGYDVKYSRYAWQLPFKLIAQLPKIMGAIRNENKWLNEQVKKLDIKMVISDNRYGLYHPTIPCIILTHQLTIITPFGILQRVLQKIHYRLLNHFNEIWVPDIEKFPSAAGILSHPEKMPGIPVRYIGWLSRFQAFPGPNYYDIVVLLSGPEPQRSMLEKKILKELKEIKGNILLIRGLPGETALPKYEHPIKIRNHLSNKELQEVIQQAEWIICRSGYTTIMELLSLQKKAILIPTPGQTEQIYLAERLRELNWAVSIDQNFFNGSDIISVAGQFSFSLPQPMLSHDPPWLPLLKKLLSPNVALPE
jgi:uncharacterized protein (TIGR00661 family)